MELKPLVIRQSIGTRANVTCSYRSSSRHRISFMKNYKNARSKVPPIYGDTKSMQEYCSRSITCWTSQSNISFVVERDLLSVRCDVANENGIIFGQMTALINPSGFVLANYFMEAIIVFGLFCPSIRFYSLSFGITCVRLVTRNTM